MRIYSNIKTHETICERWGASTKHPDAQFYFSKHETSYCVERATPWDLYQWLIECACDCAFPFQIPHNIKCVNELMRQYCIAVDGNADAWDFITAGF